MLMLLLGPLKERKSQHNPRIAGLSASQHFLEWYGAIVSLFLTLFEANLKFALLQSLVGPASCMESLEQSQRTSSFSKYNYGERKPC